MKLPEGVILLDSLGDVKPENSSPILVCGSHCGDNGTLARKLKKCNIRAVFLNNAGIGKNQAGISGLKYYNSENILACAVDHNSAEIGVAKDTWERGIISHTNDNADIAGIKKGDSVKKAVATLIKSCNVLISEYKNPESISDERNIKQSQTEFKKQSKTEINGISITVTDSITFLDKTNSDNIVVCGSHGGVSAGEYAQKYRVKAVFFNDAGIGKNNAGIKSLDSLDKAGILACTVNCMSAEIFNGHDTLENGVISVCNRLAKTLSIKENMKVKDAIAFINNK